MPTPITGPDIATSISISGQSGLLTFAGLTGTNRIKTVRDAADTLLELGGSYTPTGIFTNLTMVTPVLGTPSSGTLSNCTAATDSVAGVMSAADHITLTSLSTSTGTGVAPAFTGIGVPVTAFKSGIDLKSNATTDIFTVPASRTFVCTSALVTPTTASGSTATTFTFKIIESGASASMTTVAAAANVAAATTKGWAQNATAPATGPYFNCAAGNKVQLNISTAAAGTTVTGNVLVFGYYIT